MPYLSPPLSTSARSVCLSLNTIQVQIIGARLANQVQAILLHQAQQTLLRRAQQPLLRQAQQALPNWPNIYKLAYCTQCVSTNESRAVFVRTNPLEVLRRRRRRTIVVSC